MARISHDLEKLNRKSVFLALLSCKDEEEMTALINDLLAPIEIENAKKRWNIAQSRLATNCSQNAIIEYHNISQNLAERVIQELEKKSKRGYRLAYRRLFGCPLDEVP